MLAVDDSRSMAENGCGGFALEAVTLLARALAQLEVGQLGVLRFGGTDHVRVLHPLDAPFSAADGPRVLSQLRFDQVRCPAAVLPTLAWPLSRLCLLVHQREVSSLSFSLCRGVLSCGESLGCVFDCS